MAIKVKTKRITFSDGSKLLLSQSNWDISMKLSALERHANENPSEDNDLQLFRIAFYPKLLAAVVEGDPPTDSEARAMPEEDLDLWYNAVKELNPKWFAVIDKAIESMSEEEREAAERKKKKRRRTK